MPTRPRRRTLAGSGTAQLRTRADTLLRVEHLTVEYPLDRHRRVHAVSDVSFDIATGETLGLVGETGCGKSTTGRAVLQLPPPTSGSVVYDGHELVGLPKAQLRELRPSMQIVLQDPISSLNPRRKVHDIVAAPLRVWKHKPEQIESRVTEVLDAVGLDVVASRRPAAPLVLGRAGAADLHRPGPGLAAPAAHLRRAGVRPRRLRAGADPQPAPGPQGPVRPDDAVHLPRPRRRQPRQRPGRGDVPRQAVRDRRCRCRLRRPRSSLHRRAARFGARAGSDERARRSGAVAGDAIAGRSAERLSVPYPLRRGPPTAARPRNR